ncbi:hypothetical protein N9R43_00965, partial [bacterium]|nr:hypothetical protein [bacterium]
HIWEEVKPFLEANPSIVLDGELYNHEYKANFNKITSLVRNESPTVDELAEVHSKVQYHVYDCYNKYVVDMPFSERIVLTNELQSDIIHIVETDYASFQEELDALYSDYMERGYEGQMVRNDTPYEPNKRSKNLLKRKEFITSEFKVIEMLEGAVQTQILGVSAGMTTTDKNCERLKLAKTMYDMGMKVAAVSIMCQDERVFDAMEMAGTPCPFLGKIGEEAQEAWGSPRPKARPNNITEREDKKDETKKTVLQIVGGALLIILLL